MAALHSVPGSSFFVWRYFLIMRQVMVMLLCRRTMVMITVVIMRGQYRRHYDIGAHHFVVLMFHDMAVPHIETGDVELGLHRRDLSRIGDHRVLVARLRWFDRVGGATHNIRSA